MDPHATDDAKRLSFVQCTARPTTPCLGDECNTGNGSKGTYGRWKLQLAGAFTLTSMLALDVIINDWTVTMDYVHGGPMPVVPIDVSDVIRLRMCMGDQLL